MHRMKHTYPRAIQLVKNGREHVASLVTYRFSPAEAAQAYAAAEMSEGIKAVVDC
jgi:threonine dehydrogenase-like Zn-dependent dehydrogenase